MSIKIFPSANEVGGEGQAVFTESSLAAWVGQADHIRSGLTVSKDATNIRIASGSAIIDGRLVVVDTPVLVPITSLHAASFNIYLQLFYDSLGNAYNAAITFSEYAPNPEPVPENALRIGSVTRHALDDDFSVASGPRHTYSPWPLALDILNTYYYDTQFEGLGGFQTVGAVTVGNDGAQLSTSSQIGSIAKLTRPAYKPGASMESFQLWMRIRITGTDAQARILPGWLTEPSGYIGFTISGYDLSCVYKPDWFGANEVAVATSTVGNSFVALSISRTPGYCAWLKNGHVIAECDSGDLPTTSRPGTIFAEIKATSDTVTSLYLNRYIVASPNIAPGGS